MHERRFSAWASWALREQQLSQLESPGVYAIALGGPGVGAAFSWSRRIVYIGMSNAVAGLAGRLGQFDATMRGMNRHGGADRVRLEYPDYSAFAARCRVAVAPFPCDPTSNLPSDLRTMGDVARFEFHCLAQFVDQWGRLPLFNDKRRSPKHSRTFGTKGRVAARLP